MINIYYNLWSWVSCFTFSSLVVCVNSPYCTILDDTWLVTVTLPATLCRCTTIGEAVEGMYCCLSSRKPRHHPETRQELHCKIFHRIIVDMHTHHYWRWLYNVGFTECWLLSHEQKKDRAFWLKRHSSSAFSCDATHFLTYLSHLPFALFSLLYEVIKFNHMINIYYNLWSWVF